MGVQQLSDLRGVFEGLARGHRDNVCLRHLLLARCSLKAEVACTVSATTMAWLHQAQLASRPGGHTLGKLSVAALQFLHLMIQVLSMISWNVAMMGQVTTLDLSDNPELGAAEGLQQLLAYA
jgi:hypothetical protein